MTVARETLALTMTEAALQEAVLDNARARGWLAYHTYDSRRSEPGFPDLVLVRSFRIVFVELKKQKASPTPSQRVWLDALAGAAQAIGAGLGMNQGAAGRAVGPDVEVYTWRPIDWLTGEIERKLN